MTTEITTLSNGLRIATDRIDTVDTVSLGLWVDVGTRHEAAAVWMAAASFQARGELAVCFGESGPGSHNLVSALGSVRSTSSACAANAVQTSAKARGRACEP